MSLRDWINTHRIIAFFLLTFGISWSLNGLVILLEMEMSWTRWLLSGLLSASGPAFAAVIVVHVGDESLREWARGIVKWRVHPLWYGAAIGIPAGLAIGSGVLSYAVGGPIDWSTFPPELFALAFGIVLATFIGGGQEEIGWRGFAQPEMQARYGALASAIGIGLIWGAWHLPLFFDPMAPHSQWPISSQLAYFVGITGFSVLLAWVYNGTGGSILLAMVMHGSKNALGGLVPLDIDVVIVDEVVDYEAIASVTIFDAVLTWVIALIVIGVIGRHLYERRSQKA